MNTELDLTKLRKTAEGVEKREWTVATGGIGTSVYSNWDNEHGEYAKVVADGLDSEEAEHIATFDPPTVLALLDRLETAEAEASKYRGLYDEAESAHTDAEAKLARVRELHPREVIAVHEGHGEEAICPRCQVHWPCKTIRTLDGA